MTQRIARQLELPLKGPEVRKTRTKKTASTRAASGSDRRKSQEVLSGRTPTYRAPKGPKPPSLSDLEAAGVRVDRIKGHLALEERETGVAFLETDAHAEVTTANAQWIKRIESLGYKPKYVTIYEDGGEIRVYDVPKRIIQMPSDQRQSSHR